MTVRRMTRRARVAIEGLGLIFIVIALWPLVTAADANSPFEAIGLLLQFAQLAGVGVGIFACGRWAGDLRAEQRALGKRVDRLERHEDSVLEGEGE